MPDLKENQFTQQKFMQIIILLRMESEIRTDVNWGKTCHQVLHNNNSSIGHTIEHDGTAIQTIGTGAQSCNTHRPSSYFDNNSLRIMHLASQGIMQPQKLLKRNRFLPRYYVVSTQVLHKTNCLLSSTVVAEIVTELMHFKSEVYIQATICICNKRFSVNTPTDLPL